MHSNGSSLTSQVDPSGCHGEDRCLVVTATGVLQGSVLGPLLFSIKMSSSLICHPETCCFLSLLCWWHTTLPLIPYISWSEGSCSHLSLLDRQFLLDWPPPSTEPCEDRAACCPCHPNTTPQLLHSASFVNNNSIQDWIVNCCLHKMQGPTPIPKLIKTYVPSRSLHSASEQHLVVPSQKAQKPSSRLFPAGGMTCRALSFSQFSAIWTINTKTYKSISILKTTTTLLCVLCWTNLRWSRHLHIVVLLLVWLLALFICKLQKSC